MDITKNNDTSQETCPDCFAGEAREECTACSVLQSCSFCRNNHDDMKLGSFVRLDRRIMGTTRIIADIIGDNRYTPGGEDNEPQGEQKDKIPALLKFIASMGFREIELLLLFFDPNAPRNIAELARTWGVSRQYIHERFCNLANKHPYLVHALKVFLPKLRKARYLRKITRKGK